MDTAVCPHCKKFFVIPIDLINHGTGRVARIRYVDGGGQIITENHLKDPARLVEILSEWLRGHVEAAKKQEPTNE